AGAIAGAQEMRRNRRDYFAHIRPAAVNDTALHGYDESRSEIDVTVNLPPASGPRTGDTDSVEVIVAKQTPTMLMRILGPKLTTVRARAVAGVKQAAADTCIYALHPTARHAFKHNGTPSLKTDCAVVVNSNHP